MSDESSELPMDEPTNEADPLNATLESPMDTAMSDFKSPPANVSVSDSAEAGTDDPEDLEKTVVAKPSDRPPQSLRAEDLEVVDEDGESQPPRPAPKRSAPPRPRSVPPKKLTPLSTKPLSAQALAALGPPPPISGKPPASHRPASSVPPKKRSDANVSGVSKSQPPTTNRPLSANLPASTRPKALVDDKPKSVPPPVPDISWEGDEEDNTATQARDAVSIADELDDEAREGFDKAMNDETTDVGIGESGGSRPPRASTRPPAGARLPTPAPPPPPIPIPTGVFLGTPPHGNDVPPPREPLAALVADDEFDAAKTQKLDRVQLPDEADGPPDIDALLAASEDHSRKHRSQRPKGRRKAKRGGVRIPDDSPPHAPTAIPDDAVPPPRKDLPSFVDDSEEARVAVPPAAPSSIPSPVPAPAAPDAPTPGTGTFADLDDEPTLLKPDNRLAEALEAAAAEAKEDEHEREEVASSARQSAPGIFTDDNAIAVLRPIQIMSDLPAVAPSEDAEEVEPDAVVPPPPTTPASGPPKAPPSKAPSTAKRPLPPPRHQLESTLDEIEEIEPDRMSLPHRPPPPTRTPLGSQVDDSELAAAEARVREAEARAKEAEARAKEALAKAEAAKAKSARPKKPWWVEMFEGELLRTLDNPRRADVERDSKFIKESLRLDAGSRILDLACGAGVHAVELASQGYQLVGVDLSEKMLDLARAYNEKRGGSVSFIQGDMRQLNLEGVFDGIFCWASSFGYFDDQTNLLVLERIARALRPGGMFTLDVDNRDYIAPRAPSMAWFEKPGCVCMDEMRFDFFSSRMHTKRMVLFDSGKSREVETSIRLYTLTELGRMLQKCGFRVLEVSGHRAHRAAYFGAESPRIMITAQRREDAEPSDG